MELVVYAAIMVLACFCGITGYIVVMTFKPYYERGELGLFPWWVKAVVAVWAVTGLISDWLINWFLMSVRHLDPPREMLVTSRLKRYKRTNDRRLPKVERGWRWLRLLDKGHW